MRRSLFGVAILMISAWLAAMPLQAASSFADPAFKTQWQKDEAVAPNFWGPLPLARDGQMEPYAQSGQSGRLVQYFDKGRMELCKAPFNCATTPVTSGLLATDLVKGQIQVGDVEFQQKAPPGIPFAGNPDTPAPTYAVFTGKAASLLAVTPKRVGMVTTRMATDGALSNDTGAPYVVNAFDDVTQHNVVAPFADFRAKVGVTVIGYAISEPFLLTIVAGGTRTDMGMAQVFERRILTYNPTNPDAFKVEFGNIGQHYYKWRYGGNAFAPSASATVIPPSVSATYPGKIVYETGTGDMNAAVYIMNADGSGKANIGDGRSPLFAPDGRRVAFYTVSPTPTSRPFPDVIIRSTDFTGGTARDEVVFTTSAYQTLVRWSPSGHYIAMNSTQNGPGQISLFDTTTGKFAGDLKYLQGSVNLIFDWTSDGSTALWQASKDFAGPRDLYFGDPDTRGDGAAQLTHGENQIVQDTAHFYASARISPDGKTIAVAGTKVFFLSVPGQVSPLDGKSMDALSDVYSLAWSPDGRALAVARRLSSSRDDTGRSLSVVDIASGQVVTSVPGAGRADWSRQ